MRWMASASVRACVSDSMTQGPAIRKRLAAADGHGADIEGMVLLTLNHSMRPVFGASVLSAAAADRNSVRLGPLRIVVDGLLLAVAPPGVSVPALEREIIHIVMQRLVAIAEDRFLRRNTVVARPKRAGAGGGHKFPAVGAGFRYT